MKAASCSSLISGRSISLLSNDIRDPRTFVSSRLALAEGRRLRKIDTPRRAGSPGPGRTQTTLLSAYRSGNYPQRVHAREIAVMCHQGGGVDRQRARRLNGVGKLETERSPQSCSAFRDVRVEADRMPRFEDGPVTPRERVVGCLE